MWLSSMILLPIGIFLTYKAATESSLLNADAWMNAFRKTQSVFKHIGHQVKNKFKQ
jgi:lipopolysaccharide export system permease protein